jgi:hypothetical protein
MLLSSKIPTDILSPAFSPVARLPHSSKAKSLDSLMERTREAIELCLEVQDVPPEPLEFIGVQRITIAV